MVSDQTKQLLGILKRQALIVSGQDIDKMDVGESFMNVNALTRIALKHLILCAD